MGGKSIAVIPARGGSRRIPRKNIREFCGKPVIAYVIRAALEAEVFDEVMVSTEDEEIKKTAVSYGADVPFLRSEETAGDFATTREVLLEVLSDYRAAGMEFDTMACLYPANPFATAGKIRKMMELLESCGCDAVEAVTAFSFPPQRAYVLRDGCLRYKWPENRNVRSQDLEPFYHDAGQMYAYRVSEYVKADGSLRRMPYVLHGYEVQDIDHEDDWEVAEFKYEFLKKKGLLGGGLS